MSILLTGHCCIIMWSCCCRWVFVWQKLCAQDFYGYHRSLVITLCDWIHTAIGQSRIISSDVADCIWYWTSKPYIWTLADWSYWLVSFWNKQDRYIWMSLELLYEHYHRSLSQDEHYHRSLTGAINRYHRSINKTYIRRTFNIIEWTSYDVWWSWLMNIAIWNKQCSWISHLELTSHRSGQALCRIKLQLDCYRSCFNVFSNNWTTIALAYYLKWTMFTSHHSYTEVTSCDWTYVTSDDHHIPSQL